MNKEWKNLISPFLTTLLVVAIGMWGVFHIIEIAEKEQTAKEPNATPPVTNDVPLVEEPEIQSLILIKPEDKYIIKDDPYSSTLAYKGATRQFALMGDFSSAHLIIRGTVPASKEHFLSISLDQESGTYNAVRKAAAGLDIVLSQQNGGVFTSDEPIKVKFDLMKEQLFATTKKEFTETGAVSKTWKLWDTILPKPPAASVNRILVAPFNRDGQFAGTIDVLTLEFSCSEKDSCHAVLCKNGEKATACLTREFGASAAKEWEGWYAGQ